MLRSAAQSISTDLDDLVEDLLRDDSDFDRTENRSAHREHLVLPLTVKLRDPDQELSAFSRNISQAGIGLITQDEVREDANAFLVIERLDGRESRVLARCRWCKSYGKSWYLSGWQFMSLS